ncbi:vam6/Vps39-like protein [Galendromus occidentalis]|uniref:Vam6/Vps39-like protein n=1 Tax=Galendromus occidentalis TaxID=34638 RepID=A0AAJ6VWF9_9ACAR|nr:vam6/Vps39-like protein [Galendromus occidentalis]
MYKAYSLEPVLQNLPATFSVVCAATYKDSILLGTKQGQLVTFTVTDTPSAETSFDVRLRKTNKTFSRKPVNQMAVIEAHDILISLSDGLVSVHALSDQLPLLQQLTDHRGASVFACTTETVEVQNEDDSEKKYFVMVKMCIAVKRRLHLFYWKHNRFLDYPSSHVLPDVPRTMLWSSEDHLIIGFKSDYILLKARTAGEVKELFPLGRQPEPLLAKLHGDNIAMLLEKQLILAAANGKPTEKYSINLRDTPVSVTYDHPNVIAVSNSGIEIHTIHPRLDIQEITMQQSPKPHALITWKAGRVFVVSTNNVWCMVRTPISEQMQSCKEKKLYTLALTLADLLDTNDADKALCKYHINNLLAFDHFVNRRYDTALKLFEEIQTDPLHVIGLFPTLLKDQHRKFLDYPGPLPDVSADLGDALHALTAYLKAARRTIIGQTGESVKVGGILEGTAAVRPKKELLQIIDTTILKSYLQTNPSLVASLLRYRDNHCHLEESESALLQHHKYTELIILYEQKGQHRKALQLLFEQAHVPNSPLNGHEKTVQYLQRLSVEHFELILEYAKWVIEAFQDDGLKIFIEEKCEREKLPRDRVIQYLTKEAPALILPYLEHIILKWRDDNILFHNMLVHKYREQILLRSDNGVAGEAATALRQKLLVFLRTSERYTVNKFPQYFLDDKLYLECAIVMGKLGRHQDALTIYIHVLRDLDLAEQYCLEHYLQHKTVDREVFLILLSLCNRPADVCLKALNIGAPPPTEPINISRVLEILNRHADKLDPLRAVEEIPPEVSLKKLEQFLTGLLETQNVYLSKLRLRQALLMNENFKMKEIKMDIEKNPVLIQDSTLCDICGRRINRSVFVMTEDQQIVHYACHKRDMSM